MKPCPFCGQTKISGTQAQKFPGVRYYMIRCAVCNGSIKDANKIAAIEAWNRRPA
jgi:Lar family restriction alleviation protein